MRKRKKKRKKKEHAFFPLPFLVIHHFLLISFIPPLCLCEYLFCSLSLSVPLSLYYFLLCTGSHCTGISFCFNIPLCSFHAHQIRTQSTRTTHSPELFASLSPLLCFALHLEVAMDSHQLELPSAAAAAAVTSSSPSSTQTVSTDNVR